MTTENWVPSIEEPRGGESPLLDFTGVLKDWVRVQRDGQGDDGKPYTIMDIEFHFIDLEVIDSVEPYPHQVADIRIRYTDNAKSRGTDKWAHFAESLRDFFGKDAQAINKLQGKRQHWKKEMRKTRAPLPEDGDPTGFTDIFRGWGNTLMLAWVVKEVEGLQAAGASNGVNVVQKAVDLAVGKDATAFYEAAMADADIRRDTQLMSKLMDKSFLQQALDNGLLVQGADGILAKAS